MNAVVSGWSAVGAPPAISEGEFRQLRKMIYEIAGISLSDAKRALVAGRLAKRLRQRSVTSYGDYFRLIMSERAELQTAIDLLTTNETYFFREPSHFDLLRERLLPALGGRAPLRIWSGACSSGEEPYTLAMVLADALGARPWEVLASDISSRVLEQAALAEYPMARSSSIPREYLVRYCLRGVGPREGTFTIAEPIRKRVRFMQVNLNDHLPNIGPFDVVFLRNVMIYFDGATKRRVVERILPLLRPGGYLLLSHSESLTGVCDGLQTVVPSVYRKPER